MMCAAALAWPAPGIAASLDPDTTARILAGLQTEVPPSLDLTAHALRDYAREATARWNAYERRIGTPMQQWAHAELPPAKGATVFYPFAGPDFATVQRLYPEANRYVLVALQRAEAPPALARANAADLADFLGRFGESWQQFASMGFFRTLDLDEEAKRPGLRAGTTGRLIAFAARAGYRIVSVEPVRVNAAGAGLEPHPGSHSDPATWGSVRIMLDKNGRKVELDYVRMNLADASLNARPELRVWIERMAANRTVLKAASHLLQSARFSVVRDALLGHAPSIVQDETGIEYSRLAKHFDVTLYGRFTKPHSLFDKEAQRALAEAYQTQPNIKPLTFRVSYQREPEANLQVAVRAGLMSVGDKR
ncbi:MAG: hypothetical protein ACREUX_11895 [Burkholderiales bacterium]